MYPWCPLAEDGVIPLPVDWVVTIVDPKQKLKEMYVEDVVGNSLISESDLADEQRELISEIEEVGAEIGEPDCKLINPHEIWEGNNLAPWMMDHTMQDTFMISSDKIIHTCDPPDTP